MISAADDDKTDRTEVLQGDPETLAKELQKAQEHDPCFIVIRGPGQGQRHFITQEEMVIGRDPVADITVADPSISRRHSRVFKKEGQVLIGDLGSANGTVINGKKLPKGEVTALAKEDMIRLGNSILKFLPAGELEILMYGHLENAALTDPMTKIYNKKYLLEALDAEFKRAKTLNNDFSILFFDIDHFKKINDTYGHDAGDYVLKEFTALIKTKCLRPKDVFSRYGGEEFVVLLLNTPAQQAAEIAETVRAQTEAHAYIYEGKRIKVTASIGVAELNSLIDSPQSLLKVADKALYSSKQNGRNQVTVAS